MTDETTVEEVVVGTDAPEAAPEATETAEIAPEVIEEEVAPE